LHDKGANDDDVVPFVAHFSDSMALIFPCHFPHDWKNYVMAIDASDV